MTNRNLTPKWHLLVVFVLTCCSMFASAHSTEGPNEDPIVVTFRLTLTGGLPAASRPKTFSTISTTSPKAPQMTDIVRNDSTTIADRLPTFGDTVQILGAMKRTDQDFQDGLSLDIFSPKNRTVVVTQNKNPLGAQFVTGTTGEGFISLSNYSYIITTSDNAKDLIAKIEIPYNTSQLAELGIQESNTYVARLAPDKRSWSIDDSTRNVHRSENNTRIIKMTSVDGEYMIVGRQSVDAGNIFVQYGLGEKRTANFTGGAGIQQEEFVDGLRFSVISPNPMRLNIQLVQGIDPQALPQGTVSLYSYAWVINTTNPNSDITAQMAVPFNRAVLVALLPQGSSPTTMLTVARKPLGAASADNYQPVSFGSQVVRELPEDRIIVPGIKQLDGQYVILVTQMGQNQPVKGASYN